MSKFVRWGHSYTQKKLLSTLKNKTMIFYTSFHYEVEFVYTALGPGLSSDLLWVVECVRVILCEFLSVAISIFSLLACCLHTAT